MLLILLFLCSVFSYFLVWLLMELCVCRDSENWTPLVVASYVGSLHMVHLLLDAGADVNARGE